MTIAGERYRAVITTFTNDLLTVLSARQFQEASFMQDGAPAQTTYDTIGLLTIFGNRIIALGFYTEWAPHSPDLTSLDFWFWDAARDSVYTFRCLKHHNKSIYHIRSSFYM